MGEVIVIEFVTLDGVVEDPDGSGATPGGGWAFRHGPEAVAGDKFQLGSLLDTGVMLLGRTTWELFGKIWPGRTDEFSAKMNTIPKLVASRSLSSTDGWKNSSLIEDDLVTAVRRRKATQDIIVTGSIGVVHTLAGHGLVDEYRLMVFPTVLGKGQRLFSEDTPPADLRLGSVEQKGNAALLRYRKAE
ncbi:dihydrofolate reductase family protein [Amycolatopsis sp. H20-H5]|uniref:dihydrofolate reductase family protein n=1 Tax=Amycolatopsis sp. H20-H5 TaxID=3046309 RepID=UPI002DC03CA2|nr:dihydrofolate reductase family protein [Amycolatopsis sp. H20-H5]MEC3980813.1 dihydrofolate reductase family protein [Amycolatopsis sp. H20-H5]